MQLKNGRRLDSGNFFIWETRMCKWLLLETAPVGRISKLLSHFYNSDIAKAVQEGNFGTYAWYTCNLEIVSNELILFSCDHAESNKFLMARDDIDVVSKTTEGPHKLCWALCSKQLCPMSIAHWAMSNEHPLQLRPCWEQQDKSLRTTEESHKLCWALCSKQNP